MAEKGLEPKLKVAIREKNLHWKTKISSVFENFILILKSSNVLIVASLRGHSEIGNVIIRYYIVYVP